MRIKYLLLLGLLFLFTDCQKDDDHNNLNLPSSVVNTTVISQTDHFHSDFISIDSILNIKGYLRKFSETNLKGGKQLPLGLSIRLDRIKVLEDQVEIRTNYSIELSQYSKSSKLSFYSLVLSEDENGEVVEDFIVEYEMTESFYNDYISNQVQLSEFSGNVHVYSSSKGSSSYGNSKSYSTCSSTTVCGGGSGGSAPPPPSGSDPRDSGGGTTCTVDVVTTTCTGILSGGRRANHGIGDSCNCIGSSSCQAATIGLSIKCSESFNGSGCSSPSGLFPIPDPDLNRNGEPVENIDAQLVKISNLLGFKNGSASWRFFQFNNVLRSQANDIASGCITSDRDKTNDILDVLRRTPGFENQEELRYLMHKATDSGFLLSKDQHKKIFEEGLTFADAGIFDDLMKGIKKHLDDLSWDWPKSPEEWDDVADIFHREFTSLFKLENIVDFVVPGVGDIKSAIRNFRSGSNFAAAFDLTFALVDLFPGLGKIPKLVGGVASKVGRTNRIFKAYNKIRKLGNPDVLKGYRGTVAKNSKNPDKIFSGTHLSSQEFKRSLDDFGGQEEMIGGIYESAFKQGKLNNLTEKWAKRIEIDLNGTGFLGQVIKLSDGSIRIDDFWVPK